jgi:hypothetical protein
MVTVLEQELTSIIRSLPPRDVWLVVGYAKAIQTEPALSEAGRSYLAMLKDSGASVDEITRATLSVREVEQRYARLGAEAAIRDLEYRTEGQMRVWLKERGVDYDTMTDDQLYDLTNDLIQRHRQRS